MYEANETNRVYRSPNLCDAAVRVRILIQRISARQIRADDPERKKNGAGSFAVSPAY